MCSTVKLSDDAKEFIKATAADLGITDAVIDAAIRAHDTAADLGIEFPFKFGFNL